ncbi:MAG: protein kinase [Sandaracinaceae bacterium]|nr:protein kinase [Sandaracinaceae bacterium]
MNTERELTDDDDQDTQSPVDSTRRLVGGRPLPLLFPPGSLDPISAGVEGPQREEPRYHGHEVLGAGGMGEVHRAHDGRVGRTVAIKSMVPDAARTPELRARFLREARVQAQLEHPSIVPVYDLDWDERDHPYFSMRRVAGVTLTDVFRLLREGDAEITATYSLQRLLSNFQQFCLALHYAHSRGVVHRDIKPPNIMFGTFGEVYVLDWGIAKVGSDADVDLLPGRGTVSDSQTMANEVLGTPGYMAPEQYRDSSDVDARADIYSLGCILFQMLTLQPLHRFASAMDRRRSTLAGVDARASVRTPDRGIPPELDAICVRATAVDPAARFQTARELHDAVQAFLDGDRDDRLREELAQAHVEQARDAARRLREGGGVDAELRQQAFAEAGRALALNPRDQDAATLLAHMMLEAPKEMPAEVFAANEAVVLKELVEGVRLASLALLGVVVCSVFLPLLGAIRSYASVAVILVALAVAGLFGLFVTAVRKDITRRDMVLLCVPVCVAIAGFSQIVGPLVVPPVLAIGFASLVATAHWLGWYRALIIGMVTLAWLVPATLDWLGLGGPPAYTFENGLMVAFPRMMEIPEAATRGGLMALFLAASLVVSALLWRYSSWVAESRRKLHLHAWHLESLLPRDTEQSSRSAARPLPPTTPD